MKWHRARVAPSGASGSESSPPSRPNGSTTSGGDSPETLADVLFGLTQAMNRAAAASEAFAESTAALARETKELAAMLTGEMVLSLEEERAQRVEESGGLGLSPMSNKR